MFYMLFITLLTVSIIIWIISWLVHVDMTKSFTDKYGYGNYSKFVDNLEMNNLKYSNGFLYNYSNDSEIDCSIIKFNGVGMLLNPIDWIKANVYIYRMKNKKRIYKW